MVLCSAGVSVCEWCLFLGEMLNCDYLSSPVTNERNGVKMSCWTASIFKRFSIYFRAFCDVIICSLSLSPLPTKHQNLDFSSTRIMDVAAVSWLTIITYLHFFKYCIMEMIFAFRFIPLRFRTVLSIHCLSNYSARTWSKWNWQTKWTCNLNCFVFFRHSLCINCHDAVFIDNFHSLRNEAITMNTIKITFSMQ